MGYQVEPNVFSDRVMSEVEAAYLAGVVDGEGSLQLRAIKGQGRRSHHFLAMVEIGNSNLELLRWVVRTTGNGRITVNKRPTESQHKQVFSWQLAPRQIHHVLPQIAGYLVAKRRQAEILLRYFAIQRAGARADGVGRTPEEAIPEVLALREELCRLNRRGLTAPEALEFSLRDKAERVVRLCQQEGCTDHAYRMEEFCYKHFLLRRKPQIKNCERCGEEMDAILPRKRFCSKKCQWQAGYDRRAQGHRQFVVTSTNLLAPGGPRIAQEFVDAELAQAFLNVQCQIDPEGQWRLYAVRGQGKL